MQNLPKTLPLPLYCHILSIVAFLALEHQTLPGSATLVSPDPGLALDIVIQPRTDPIRLAMSNSFGFGGTNCSLIFASEAVG